LYFLVDAQLPIALARWLSTKGHHSDHVHDLGLEGASDTAIWIEAIRRNAVIVTKDEDFVAIDRKGPAAQVVWIRNGNLKRKDLIIHLEKVIDQVVRALASGEKIIEVR
jgi:predicted nuclease of predicted toxin-antitoxin system